MKLSEVVKSLNGCLVRDGEFDTLEYCTSDMKNNFLSFLENIKFVEKISPFVTCILCKEELVCVLPETIKGVYVVDSPKEAFHIIHNNLAGQSGYMSEVGENQFGNNCVISQRAVISPKNVRIGNNVVIEDNVVINENVIIGDDCTIHSGVVLGGKAFTFARTKEQSILGLKDVGKVILGDRVEVLSMSHIAKGILPTDITYIGDDVKIDAFVHIGHGARIEDRTMIAAGAIIGGNSRIGSDAWIGINATVSNRIVVGNRSRVSLGAVVTKNVYEGQIVTGNFAIEHNVFLHNLKSILGKV